jgi:peptide/nickel transport system substrate-binding protein
VPNAPSLLVGLRNRRLDMAVLVRPQDVAQVEGAAGLVVERSPSLNQKAIDLGTELKPLDDARVRRAIALAVDKDEIMRASIGGFGQVIGTMVAAMQDSWGVPLDKLPNQKVDIAAAKRLLAEAGHPNGFDLTLTSIIGYEWMDAAAVTLREQLAKIGIRLQIQRVELGVWIKNFQSKQMGFTFNDWATAPDPNLLFYRHFHKAPEGADFRNWANEEASRLLDEGRIESEPAKRKEIYARYQQVMAESVPTIMLFSADHIVVRSDKLRNYKTHPTGWYYGLARAWRS